MKLNLGEQIKPMKLNPETSEKSSEQSGASKTRVSAYSLVASRSESLPLFVDWMIFLVAPQYKTEYVFISSPSANLSELKLPTFRQIGRLLAPVDFSPNWQDLQIHKNTKTQINKWRCWLFNWQDLTTLILIASIHLKVF